MCDRAHDLFCDREWQAVGVGASELYRGEEFGWGVAPHAPHAVSRASHAVSAPHAPRAPHAVDEPDRGVTAARKQ